MLKIEGQKRELKEALDTRKELKAVVYGPHIEENILVKLPLSSFKKVYDEAGTSQIISLSIDGEDHDVMIKDFQLDPVSDEFKHVDFYAVTKGEEMEVVVPFVFVGDAPALEGDNILNKVLTDIKIKSLPKDIPAELEIDLTVLKNAGDAVRLEDVNLPEGVKFSTENLDEVIVSVSAAKEEVEEVATEEEAGGEEEKAEEDNSDKE